MPKTIVYRLPKSEDDEVLKVQSRPSRLLRLRSLQSDPANFHSKYEVEINYEQELWLSRLRGPYVQHFVLIDVDDMHNEKDEIVLDDTTEFQGMMVVINEYEEEMAEHVQSRSAHEADTDDCTPTYFLACLYVETSVRSRGLGSKIIEEGIEWVKQDARSKGWEVIRYRVTALEGNDRAISLYIRHGFQVDGVSKKGTDDDDIHTELSMIIKTK